VELAALGLSSGTAEVTLEVTNEASRGITLSGFLYDLEIRGSEEEGWVQLAEGFHPQEVALAGDETLEVTVPVTFEYRSLGAAVRGFLSRGEIPYRLTGEVRVGGDTLGMDVPFRTEGILRP
jgi:LEA14-like dessication related protein